ncbi:MAG: universal stress protein [Pseudohongiellaceae bacterium]|nr:universal stress protein [Pseudohongiellaceae bacterium]
MKVETKVLACVDRSHFADYVADYAAWAARRMDAPLELLHVINKHPERSNSKDHSGTIGIDAQENLLDKLSEEDKSLTLSVREQGRMFLNRLRQRVTALGVANVDVRQRHGDLEETLSAQEKGVRLIVLGRRGAASEITKRDLGRNVERVVRALHKPILTVTEGFTEPKRIMIAFDGGRVTRRGVKMVAASPLFKGLPIYLLMSGKASKDGEKQLQWAKEKLESAGFTVNAQLRPGDAETVIAKAASEFSIDMLIMGSFSHSPLRSLIFGSKTADLLRSSTIPTLLLR